MIIIYLFFEKKSSADWYVLSSLSLHMHQLSLLSHSRKISFFVICLLLHGISHIEHKNLSSVHHAKVGYECQTINSKKENADFHWNFISARGSLFFCNCHYLELRLFLNLVSLFKLAGRQLSGRQVVLHLAQVQATLRCRNKSELVLLTMVGNMLQYALEEITKLSCNKNRLWSASTL